MAVLEETSMSSKKTREKLKNKKKVLVVAQELKLARILAGNNKIARDRALKTLRKWFKSRSATIPFTEEDFLRIWKGLFYTMWMSDKPLVQEECAENIANLVHSLPPDAGLLFYKCGTQILINEWFGIDQLRLDKFLLFTRRLLRQILFVIKNSNWDRQYVNKFGELLSDTVFNTSKEAPLGFIMHFVEIFLEELSKVSEGDINPDLVTNFITPFIKYLAHSDNPRIIDHIKKHIFVYLINQSDLGLQYKEKYEAWKSLRFPGSIDSMQKVEENQEDEEFEDEEKVLDPRAGRVDVVLTPIKFRPKAIAKILAQQRFEKYTNSKCRKVLNGMAKNFLKLASGVYPLGVKRLQVANDNYDTNVKKAVNRLVKFEQKIMGKNKRKREKSKQNEHMIELRNGKRVKLDEELQNKVQEEMTHLMKNYKKISHKRRASETAESTKKSKLDDFIPPDVEAVFIRNSGTWFVTRRDSSAAPKKIKVKKEKNEGQSKKPNVVIFPTYNWKKTETDEVTDMMEETLKNKRVLSLPDLQQDESTPVKRVKINIKLNSSQEVAEHHAQILSSPGIPFNPNMKPSKPLLKAPTVTSPINPFYKSTK